MTSLNINIGPNLGVSASNDQITLNAADAVHRAEVTHASFGPELAKLKLGNAGEQPTQDEHLKEIENNARVAVLLASKNASGPAAPVLDKASWDDFGRRDGH